MSMRHYDKKGLLLSESSSGRSLTYSYELNAAGKPKKTNVLERSAQGTAAMEYDAEGRLTAIEANNKRQVFKYQGKGKNQPFWITSLNDEGDVVEEKLFKDGRLAQKKTPDGTVTTYTYLTDDSGKVVAMTKEMTDQDNEKTIVKYDAAGRMVSALGKEAKRFEKMAQEERMAEQVANFEMEKQLFSDPRMDGMRIDNKLLLEKVQIKGSK